MAQAKALASILKEHPTLKSLCGNKGNETELNMSGKMTGAAGAVMLAPEIVGNRALTSLDISRNKLGMLVTEDGWTSRDGDNQGPWVHPDGRSQSEKPEGLRPLGVIAIAKAIPDMGALAKFVFSGDDNSKSITMETATTVADFSGKGLGVSGVTMLSAFLPKCM
jgi:hypothetical protein